MSKKTLPHRLRLNKKGQFQSIFKNGARCEGKYVRLYYRKAADEEKKVAFVVSRKCGNAVKRNKFRRMTKEIYRNTQQSLKKFDTIWILKPRIGTGTFKELEEDINLIVEKSSLWNS